MQDRQLFPCECGADIAIGDDDWGDAVYCSSCGREVLLPEKSDDSSVPDPELNAGAAEQTSSAQEAHSETQAGIPKSDVDGVSVFTRQSVSKLEQRTVASVNCLCGQTIPITLAEVSDIVYCPSCGCAVPTRYQLEMNLGRSTPDVKTQCALTPEPPRKASSQLLRSIVAILVVGTLTVWIISISVPRRDQQEPAVNGKILAQADGEDRDFDPNALTPQAIEELKSDPDPFHALGLAAGWMQSLQKRKGDRHADRLAELKSVADDILRSRNDTMLSAARELTKTKNPADALETARQWSQILQFFDVAVDDARNTALKAVIVELRANSNPITLERIRSLRNQPLRDALVQARLWERQLASRGVSSGDPRMTALRGLVDSLLEKAVPASDAPTRDPVTEFLGLLAQASTLLAQRKLSAAEEKLQEAETRLATENESLGGYSEELDALQRRLARERMLVTRIGRVTQLLEEARRAAQSDKPIQALELMTEARFSSAQMTMPLDDAQQLRERVQSLDRDVRLARGRQAVKDALACHAEGATSVRNRQVRHAYKLLAGLPVDTVQPLLRRVAKWKEEAVAHTAPLVEYPKDSKVWLVTMRDRYESVLQTLAEGRHSEFLQQALALHEALENSKDVPVSMTEKLSDFVLDVLEHQLDETAQLSESDGGQTIASIERMLRQIKSRADAGRVRNLEARIQER